MKNSRQFLSAKALELFSVLVLLMASAMPAIASAAQLSQAGVRLGRLGISAGSGGAGDGNDLLVTFKLATTTNVTKIDVVFPVGFTVTTGTPAVGTTGFPATPASITAPPGTLTAAATSGSRDLTVSGLTTGSLSTSTLYGFTIPAGTVTNPGTAGPYSITICSETASGTAGCASNTVDTGSVGTYIFGGASNADQVTVNASVGGNFTFSLSGNTDTIPTVDPLSIRTSTGITMIVSTNSPLGYTAYVKSKNGQLTSAGTPGTPITTGTFNASADTVAAGATSYTFVPSTTSAGATNSGSIAYDGEYNVSDGTHGGSFNGTNFASFESRSGYTSGDQISLKERATVANTISAANDYTDTLTIVAAGNY